MTIGLIDFRYGRKRERIWYHIAIENGTILKENMVPYCQGKWYHILLVNGTIFFGNISLFQTQNKHFPISILAFFIFKKGTLLFFVPLFPSHGLQ